MFELLGETEREILPRSSFPHTGGRNLVRDRFVNVRELHDYACGPVFSLDLFRGYVNGQPHEHVRARGQDRFS